MPTRLFEAGANDVLYLIDLSGYVFRAYHAIPPLTSPSGEPTHATMGTVNMLEQLLRQCDPKLIAVAMDSKTPTFRKELYPEYKANRPPPPDDLRLQMRRTAEVIATFPLHCFQQDGFEADDLIATTVKHCRLAGLRVVIVSADKDLMQLVGPDVIMWDTMRNRVFGEEEVQERFGVAIPQIREVLALMGDSSDNIPGVPSVGPKTAQTLIADYGNIEGIYDNIEKVTRKKLKETLLANRAQALLSRDLVTLDENVSIDFSPEQLSYQGRNTEALRGLYEELGFQRHIGNLDKDDKKASQPRSLVPTSQTRAAPKDPLDLICVSEVKQLEQLTAELKVSQRLTLHACTMGGAPMSATLVGLSLSANSGRAYYVPLAHRYMGAPPQLSLAALKEWFITVLGIEGLSLGGHDMKSLMVLFQQRGIAVSRCDFDSMLKSYLSDPSASHELEQLCQAELGISLAPETDLTKGKGRKRLQLDEIAVEDVAAFSAPRAAALQDLWTPLSERLEQDVLEELWQDIERPLCSLLAELEQVGILIDSELLKKLGVQVGKQLAELETKAYAAAGKEFNVNSPKQLEKLLFDDLGLKPIKRTKTSRSTDAETLEALSEQHALPQIILETRQLAKLKGTYIDSLPTLVNPKTGRLHTRWHQDVAATGRLSSSDPNLQNIPIRTELGRQIRAAFIAPEGYQLVSADYSQIELRVLAHLSQDAVLLDAFRTGQDIHLRTAMEIFEVDADEVDAELRRQAKAVNFGVIYGQGDSALGKSLGISRMEAGQFIAAYFRRYEGVRRFMDETLETARASGSVRTLLGRQRIVPDVHNGNRARRLAAERIVMNTPIQGTAADLLKMAMLRLRTPVTPGSKMLLTVHDELVFEVPVPEVETAKQAIKAAMENVLTLDVPLVVDVGSGSDWKQAH